MMLQSTIHMVTWIADHLFPKDPISLVAVSIGIDSHVDLDSWSRNVCMDMLFLLVAVLSHVPCGVSIRII